MITLDAIRTALFAPDPYAQMDHLVRGEMASGRKVKEVFDAINPFVDTVLDTPGLTADGEEAFLGTLDALTGNCHSDCCYYDPPNTSLPTEEEIAQLPRWARVAFAARCARRVLQLIHHRRWPVMPDYYAGKLHWAVSLSEKSAARAGAGEEWTSPAGAITCANYAVDAVLNALRGDHARAVEVIEAMSRAVALFKDKPEDVLDPHTGAVFAALTINAATTVANGIADSPERYQAASEVATFDIRRDFDHLANLAEWKHWTDDTPVPPEVFGPLWPEGPPAGWPADPDLPQRTDLPLELFSAARARDFEGITEDDAVRLFDAINAYYIARTGDRLTMDDLRPLIAAGVPAEV